MYIIRAEHLENKTKVYLYENPVNAKCWWTTSAAGLFTEQGIKWAKQKAEKLLKQEQYKKLGNIEIVEV